MLKQLESFVDFYDNVEVMILIALIILGLIYYISVYSSKIKEHFADPNQPPVSLEQALPTIRANLQEELALIDKMLPHYEYFVKTSASSKAEKPSDVEAAKPKIEQDMQNEAPGKIIKLPYVKSVQDFIKTFTSAPEINRLYVAYMLLPKETSQYVSTGEYLDTKGKQLYDYVATLGKSTPTGGSKKEQAEREEMGKKTEKARGSTGETFKTGDVFSESPPPKMEGFSTNPDMPDCCTKNKVESLKITPEQISSLYYVSEARKRKIKDSTIDTVLQKLEITYKKLRDLQSQVEAGGGGTFGKIASGQSPETALINGFTDFNPNYAFLIR